jgi:hypothetical protein
MGWDVVKISLAKLVTRFVVAIWCSSIVVSCVRHVPVVCSVESVDVVSAVI